MTCEWLWLATTLEATDSLSLLEAARMETRLLCAKRVLVLTTDVWNRSAACEALL